MTAAMPLPKNLLLLPIPPTEIPPKMVEKHMVKRVRRQFCQVLGRFEGERVSHLEGGGEIHGVDLARNGFGNAARTLLSRDSTLRLRISTIL